MAKGPELSDGFTRIANEILDVLAMVSLNGTQFRLVMAIIRATYGYHAREKPISIRYLAQACDMNYRQVQRELKNLIKMNVVFVAKDSTKSKSRVIGFNKYYDTWRLT